MEEEPELQQSKYIRRKVSLAGPTNSEISMVREMQNAGGSTTSPRAIARKVPKPVVEKISSLIVDCDSPVGSFSPERPSSSARVSDLHVGEFVHSNSQRFRRLEEALNEQLDGDQSQSPSPLNSATSVKTDRLRPVPDGPNVSHFQRERHLTSGESTDLPVVKKLSESKVGSRKAMSPELSEFSGTFKSKHANGQLLSPVTSPRAALRHGARPAVQKLCSSLDGPEASPTRSQDQEAVSDDRTKLQQRTIEHQKNAARASTPSLGPMAHLPSQNREIPKMGAYLDPLSLSDGRDSPMRQSRISTPGGIASNGFSPPDGRDSLEPRSSLDKKPGRGATSLGSNSNGAPGNSNDAHDYSEPKSSIDKRPSRVGTAGGSGLQSPGTSPRAFARKLPKPAVDKLSSSIDIVPAAMQKQGSGYIDDKLKDRSRNFEAHQLSPPGTPLPGTTVEERTVRPATAARLSKSQEPVQRSSKALMPGAGASTPPNESSSDGAEISEADRPRRSFSASYRLPARTNTRADSLSPLAYSDEREREESITKQAPEIHSTGSDRQPFELESINAREQSNGEHHINDHNSKAETEKCLGSRLESSSDVSSIAHLEELRTMKTKMKDLETKLRGIISKQDEEMAHEREEVAELAKQFAAACKLIESMKKQLKVVQDENSELKVKHAVATNQVPISEENESKTQAAVQDKTSDLSDANKKVRLAQDQMAKLIARHTKEISTLSSTCDELKRAVASGKAIEAELKNENAMLQQIVSHLEAQGKLDSTASMCNVSIGIQTEDTPPKKSWNSWIWLVSLSMLSSNRPNATNSIEVQTDLSLASCFKPKMKDAGTITMQETVNFESDFERWWSGVLDCCEEELKTMKFKSKTHLSRPQILSLIANVYADKIVQDEVDDREGLPRLDFPNFLHLYFLDQKGTAIAAQKAVIVVICNILAHLRGIVCTNSSEHAEMDFETGISKGSAKCPRIIMFARFLGLKHEGLDPISVDGLSLYLAALSRAQKGQIPLLPVSGEKVFVNYSDFAQILDWAFNQTRTIIRESVKVGLMTGRSDPLDLESALEYTIDQWRDCVSKSDARLEALFSTVVAVADYAFETFDEMMQKLRVEEPVLPGHTSRLRMFQELCLFPRVDSSLFSKIAKKYGIFKFHIGCPPGLTKLDLDASALFDSLAPLYSAALRTISGKLPELDQIGHGRGIERKWAICGELLKEREFPETAWIFYHMVTRQYSTSMRHLKARGEKGTGNAPLIEFDTFQPEGQFLGKKGTQRERSSFARDTP